MLEDVTKKSPITSSFLTGIEEDAATRLTSILVDHRSLAIIAYGLTSPDASLVSASVFLLNESIAASSSSSSSSSRAVSTEGKPEFGFDAFALKLASLNAEKESHHHDGHPRHPRSKREDGFDGGSSSSSSLSGFPSKRHASSLHVDENKENVFATYGRSYSSSGNNSKAAAVPPASEMKVDSLLSKLSSTDDAGDVVKDLRTSEILSVYEHKFKSLSMKENHLQVSFCFYFRTLCCVFSSIVQTSSLLSILSIMY